MKSRVRSARARVYGERCLGSHPRKDQSACTAGAQQPNHFRTQTTRAEETMKSFASIAGFVAVMALCAAAARAQDPATTDPAHFKVELENDRARVLHVTVEPNTKIELHELDDAVVVPLSDYESTLKTAHGQTTKVDRTAGKPGWVPAGGREFEAGSCIQDWQNIRQPEAAQPVRLVSALV